MSTICIHTRSVMCSSHIVATTEKARKILAFFMFQSKYINLLKFVLATFADFVWQLTQGFKVLGLLIFWNSPHRSRSVNPLVFPVKHITVSTPLAAARSAARTAFPQSAAHSRTYPVRLIFHVTTACW